MEGIRAMPTINIDKTIQAWSNLNDTLFVPHTEAEYQKLVDLLDDLIDEVGEDESHPLASLMEVIGFLIESYESKNIPELI
jgi:HTH-type transcriptional regulator/antitoxin HigA